jgi:hypothetical protein
MVRTRRWLRLARNGLLAVCRSLNTQAGSDMTLPARFSLLHSDFNDFLFAFIGDQQNGMPLNVVSALTRLDVDPWEEAARLAALPKVLATEALEPMIARLPIFRRQQSDNLAISRRLVELLPSGQQATTQRREQAGAKEKEFFHTVMVLACLALVAAALYAVL